MTYTHYKQLLNLLHIKSMYTCGSGIYWHEQCWWMIMFMYIWTMTLKKISCVFVYCIDMKQFTQNVFIYYFKYTCIYWNTVTFHLADILHPWIFTQLGLHRQFIKILFSSGETHRKQYVFPQKLVSVRDVQYRKRTEYMCLVNAKKIGMSHHTHFA
jgi:hypothetical protein